MRLPGRLLGLVLLHGCAGPMPSGTDGTTSSDAPGSSGNEQPPDPSAGTTSEQGEASDGEDGEDGEDAETGSSTAAASSETGTATMPTPACQRYLACVEAVDPWELDDAEASYGPGTACWTEGPDAALACDGACAAAAQALVEAAEAANDPVWAVCVGVSVGFEADIQPILSDNCVMDCHEPGGVWAAFDLRPGQAYDNVVGVPAPTQALHMNCVEPFDADASYLWHKLNGTQLEVGGEGLQAPDDAPPLDDELLALIESWIEQGAYR